MYHILPVSSLFSFLEVKMYSTESCQLSVKPGFDIILLGFSGPGEPKISKNNLDLENRIETLILK